jgi:hypothetical protein
VASPLPDTYTTDQTITLTCATAGADIRYTLDNSDPTSASTLYTGPFELTRGGYWVKARGFKAAMDSSTAFEGLYYVDYPDVAAPVVSPSGGVFSDDVVVSVTCATVGATIHYRTDGQTATDSDPVWPGDTTFTTTTTLSVRAYKDAMDPGGPVTDTYAIVRDLIAHYPFDGDANDASGNGHHGTVNSATYVDPGNGDGYYEFDGIDDYIQLADESAFDQTAFTITFRMFLPSLPASDGPFQTDPGEWVWVAKGPAYGNFRFQLRKYGGASYGVFCYQHTDSGGTFTSGDWLSGANVYPSTYSWQHIALTVGNDLKIYRNGQLVWTDATVTVPLTNNDPVLIGKATDGDANDLFTGRLDDVRFYSRELTAAEVLSIYSGGG